jgi:hypothetical protein
VNPLLLGLGVVILVGIAYATNFTSQRNKWRRHNIHSYQITLRQNYPDELGRELGNGTTLVVRDGQLVSIQSPMAASFNEEDYLNWTVEGLFNQTMFIKHAQYHSFYGFPVRLSGSRGLGIGWYDDSWVVEVVDFQPLD